MILSAHQANFFPYEGVIEKIRQSDIFVALTKVQFTRNNYHNRFQMGGKWYTMPVSQKLEPLDRKRYADPVRHWQKIKRQLPQYAATLERFDRCFTYGDRMVSINFNILLAMLQRLNVTTGPNIQIDTFARMDGDSASARLLALCQDYGADVYLSGPSGKNYLDLPLFDRAGIEVRFQLPTRGRAALELLAAREGMAIATTC